MQIEAQQVKPGEVRAQVDDGTLDAAVVGGRIVAKDEPDDELLALLQAANRQVSAARALEQAGVPEGRAQRILDPQPLKLATLEPSIRTRTPRPA